MQEEPRRYGMGMFEDNVRVIGVLPKNNITETRVTFKNVASNPRQTPQGFVDIREYWFKNVDAEPIPTGKGVMVKEEQVPKLIEFLLSGLADGVIAEEIGNKMIRLIEAKKK